MSYLNSERLANIAKVKERIAQLRSQIPFYGKVVSPIGNLSPLGRIDKIRLSARFLYLIITQEKINQAAEPYEKSEKLKIPLTEIEDISFFKSCQA
jgi:hypothetical protein